jgi:hypothetical protein
LAGKPEFIYSCFFYSGIFSKQFLRKWTTETNFARGGGRGCGSAAVAAAAQQQRWQRGNSGGSTAAAVAAGRQRRAAR